MTGNTIERARYRWREILPQLGIETKFLRNKHGPCPLCGGKDRYRFDDKEGSGSYYCSQCGAGSGVILVRKLNGWNHAEACNAIDKIIGTAPRKPYARAAKPPWTTPAVRNPTPIKPAANKSDSDRRLKSIERLLAEARAPNIVDAYLRRRGLTVSSPVLRGHPQLPFYDGAEFRGRFPAVIAPIIGPQGAIESALRIYDADVRPRKKTLSPVTTINGAAIRLHPAPEGELGLAEGVETALACFELFRVPTWSAISANGMLTFEPPQGLRRLIIFGDRDKNGVGQSSAYALASRLAKSLEVDVQIPGPMAIGQKVDWLDVLGGSRGAQA